MAPAVEAMLPPVPQVVIPAFAAHLPDELFWEVMTLDLPDSAGEGIVASARQVLASSVVAAPATAAPNTILSSPAPTIVLSAEPPVVSVPGGSAIRLYREIGVRQSIAPAVLPVAAQEVSSAPVAEAPSVVEPQGRVEQVMPAERVAVEPRFTPRAPIQASQPMFREAPVFADGEYEYPSIDLLQEARVQQTTTMTPEALEQSAGLLESVLEDFGIKGEIIDVRPGPL